MTVIYLQETNEKVIARRISKIEQFTHRPYHIMIVDDTYKNLEASREYFGILNEKVAPILRHDIETRFFYDPNAAIYTIQSSQNSPDERPTIIITDLEMPGDGKYNGKFAGLDVVDNALKNLIFPFLIREKNYDITNNGRHNSYTEIHPTDYEVEGKKDSYEIWGKTHDKILEYLTNNEEGIMRLTVFGNEILLETITPRVAGLILSEIFLPRYADKLAEDEKLNYFVLRHKQPFKKKRV